VVLAWLILSDRPSAMVLFGILLVLLGLVAISGVGARRRG
jgi:drug/metabolite transporter (DMT)-like permease